MKSIQIKYRNKSHVSIKIFPLVSSEAHMPEDFLVNSIHIMDGD